VSSIGIGIATDKGLRLRNEDSAIVMIAAKDADHSALPLSMAAISDGVSGLAHGEQASTIAIETVADYAAEELFVPNSRVLKADAPEAVSEILIEVVTKAHEAVKEGTPSSATTLTCALVAANTVYVAHVGDSRAYLIRPGSVDLLTNDHRIVRQMEAVGMLTHEEAMRHPQKHILYRSLGVDKDFEVDVSWRDLRSSSRLLLCTDGIWDALSTNNIYMWLVLGQSPQDICERLIRDAMLHRANDNATAVLLHVPAVV